MGLKSQFEDFINGVHLVSDSLEAQADLLPPLGVPQGTYSSRGYPQIDEKELSDLVELMHLYQRPKIPPRVYYIESKHMPSNIMYRLSPKYTSLGREVVTFHPHSAHIFLEWFREMGIAMIPYFNLFPWCENYKSKHHETQENYDEFWNDLKSKTEATIETSP